MSTRFSWILQPNARLPPQTPRTQLFLREPLRAQHSLTTSCAVATFLLVFFVQLSFLTQHHTTRRPLHFVLVACSLGASVDDAKTVPFSCTSLAFCDAPSDLPLSCRPPFSLFLTTLLEPLDWSSFVQNGFVLLRRSSRSWAFPAPGPALPVSSLPLIFF